jgi:hypothetical protein
MLENIPYQPFNDKELGQTTIFLLFTPKTRVLAKVNVMLHLALLKFIVSKITKCLHNFGLGIHYKGPASSNSFIKWLA